MYVCICSNVTDHQIRQAVGEGACCLKEISARLGVATCCGKCKQCAREVIKDALSQEIAEIRMPFPMATPA